MRLQPSYSAYAVSFSSSAFLAKSPRMSVRSSLRISSRWATRCDSQANSAALSSVSWRRTSSSRCIIRQAANNLQPHALIERVIHLLQQRCRVARCNPKAIEVVLGDERGSLGLSGRHRILFLHTIRSIAYRSLCVNFYTY